jgi:hypothetical protein
MTATLPLADLDNFTACHVIPRSVTHDGKPGLRLELTPDAETPDCPNFALIDGLEFHDGTIEIELAGRPLPDAPPGARGFVGIAFRIAPDLSRFECIYLRPMNGRAEMQLRRNRSTQYFSYPDFKFDRLRDEAPGEYESYVDLVPGAWTRMRIEVSGETASLFVHDAAQPTLIVNDLKHGADLAGGIGLYIDNGTEGFFRDLRVTPS